MLHRLLIQHVPPLKIIFFFYVLIWIFQSTHMYMFCMSLNAENCVILNALMSFPHFRFFNILIYFYSILGIICLHMFQVCFQCWLLLTSTSSKYYMFQLSWYGRCRHSQILTICEYTIIYAHVFIFVLRAPMST